ncbi:Flp family type IVb pilin [Aquabacterium sp. NJ1]|uniref:Flp family type IVb pilin n=1 Tax=Aquabacterium sp. NJ1 TaxID=1538295 RepID=UPI001269B7A7|nr:Flp family type IVb pilin [Aquabacterium sp. NJ1]
MTPSILMPRFRENQFGAIAIEYALTAAFVAAAVLGFFTSNAPGILTSIWQSIFSRIA